MREMDKRKRVEAIMRSKLFREELEREVSDSVKVRKTAASALVSHSLHAGYSFSV